MLFLSRKDTNFFPQNFWKIFIQDEISKLDANEGYFMLTDVEFFPAINYFYRFRFLFENNSYLCNEFKFVINTKMKKEQNVSQYLQTQGVRPSLQRIAIANYLLLNRNHPTADEIFEALCSEIPTLSKTTVYNTLKLFAEKKVAFALSIDDKNARFDACMRPHAHFKCKSCGKIIDIMGCRMPRVPQGDFVVDETQVFYLGYCCECSEKLNHTKSNLVINLKK